MTKITASLEFNAQTKSPSGNNDFIKEFATGTPKQRKPGKKLTGSLIKLIKLKITSS